MKKITGNEPAIPFNYAENTPGFRGVAVGLTIRQYYAGLAMQGLCASGFFTAANLQKQSEEVGSTISIALSISAVDIADALIEQLNEK